MRSENALGAGAVNIVQAALRARVRTRKAARLFAVLLGPGLPVLPDWCFDLGLD